MRLVLLRHAKSDWPAGASDLDRPLAPRGIKDCDLVAEFLNSQSWEISTAVVSPARRTQETFTLVSQKLRYKIDAQTNPRIYEASVAALLEVVNSLTADTAILVGHGPGIPGLAVTLADDSSSEKVHLIHAKYPTAAITVLESDLPWDKWRAHTAKICEFVTPKDDFS
jgi:phosphohistidine phosphatase